MTQGYFITGTDTGVGKTVVACALIRALRTANRHVSPRKPVESGCRIGPDGLVPADGLLLQQAAGDPLPDLATVTPHRFAHGLSPDRAARLAGARLSISALREACLSDHPPQGALVVEGAGGFYSPLAEDGLNADLAQALGLPVILVASDRLGAISQVLLTAEAVSSRSLELVTVVLNADDSPGPVGMDNCADLAAYLNCPVIAFPRVSAAGEGWRHFEALVAT